MQYKMSWSVSQQIEHLGKSTSGVKGFCLIDLCVITNHTDEPSCPDGFYICVTTNNQCYLFFSVLLLWALFSLIHCKWITAESGEFSRHPSLCLFVFLSCNQSTPLCQVCFNKKCSTQNVNRAGPQLRSRRSFSALLKAELIFWRT